jgi:putative ABC transport system permease protein
LIQGVGDTLRIRLGDGTPVALRVVATYARGLGFGDLVLSRDLVAKHVDDPLDDAILIKAAPGATHLRSLLASHLQRFAGVHIANGAGLRTSEAANERLTSRMQGLFVGLIVAFTAIALVNTLVFAIADRARELALLRLIGATRRQVRRMLQLETLIAAAIAITIGSAVAAVTASSFSAGVTHGPLRISWLTYLEVVASGALLALVTSAITAAVMLKSRPSRAMSLGP